MVLVSKTCQAIKHAELEPVETSEKESLARRARRFPVLETGTCLRGKPEVQTDVVSSRCKSLEALLLVKRDLRALIAWVVLSSRSAGAKFACPEYLRPE